MKIKIRKAALSDLTEMQALFVETIANTCKKDYNDEQINAWLSTAKNKDRWINMLTDQFFLVAELNKKIVGFASLKNSNYIDVLYVHKDFIRRGIANMLYEELKSESLKNGFDRLCSDVSKTALPFFKSKGFKVIRENKNLLDGIEIINYHMTQEGTMKIRELKSSELYFLEDMLYEAIFIPDGHSPLPREIINEPALAKYIENWGRDKFDIALVVEVKHILVGAVWGRLFKDDNKGFGYVDNKTPELSMAINSNYCGHGIGTKLINAITNEYKKIGVEFLSLSVDKANRALNLYKRLGFEVVDETETSLTMKKKIY